MRAYALTSYFDDT